MYLHKLSIDNYTIIEQCRYLYLIAATQWHIGL